MSIDANINIPRNILMVESDLIYVQHHGVNMTNMTYLTNTHANGIYNIQILQINLNIYKEIIFEIIIIEDNYLLTCARPTRLVTVYVGSKLRPNIKYIFLLTEIYMKI